MSSKGLVSIVGAGPGDPDLITVKGLHRLEQADVVLHDRLIHPSLVARSRADAKVIDVGKRFGQEDERQREIHRLMVLHSGEGKRVCRLKGGDPFIFGRVSEEIAVLIAAKIPFEIVPGVSSVTASAAVAGIALTHRDRSHGFMTVAACRVMNFDGPEWQSSIGLLRHGGTVAVLMGLGRVELIVNRLLKEGCSPETPATMVSQATWPGEAIRFGTLGNIVSQTAGLKAPALLIIGNVAAAGMAHPS